MTSQPSKRDRYFTITQLAEEFDLSLRTLRFYEDKGLINPKRDGQHRLYSRRDKARVKLILMGKKVGFSLTDIRQMLDLYDLKDGQITQLRVSLDRFREQVAFLHDRKEHIQQAIDELQRTIQVVEGMLKQKTSDGNA